MMTKQQQLNAWVNSPSFENSKQKWLGKIKDFIMGCCMAIIIIGVCYIIMAPVFGIISQAIMTWEDAINPLVFLIPLNFTLDNLGYALRYMYYLQGAPFAVPFMEGTYWSGVIPQFFTGTLMRTLLFALGFSLMHVVICSMVGYGFARFNFPGRNALFALVIISIVVPVHSYMIPMFLNFRNFLGFLGFEINLLNSWWAMTLLTVTGVGIRSGLYIYIFRQFFRGMPKEIEEAAFIDGAGPFYTYVKIMMPNAVPAIVTVLLFAFVWHYNDTFYTSMLMPTTNFLSTRLSVLGGHYAMTHNISNPLQIQIVVVSGVLLAIAPILIIYLFLQRYFVEGLERSGIVG